MTDPLAALLLGILEGLTEFLPISSTGHLLIAQRWLGARSDFFNIVIQAGAILAITLVFRERITALATGLGEARNRDYAMKRALAFLVTAVVGLPVRLLGWELPETVTPIAWALIIGGAWMIVAERLAARLGGQTFVGRSRGVRRVPRRAGSQRQCQGECERKQVFHRRPPVGRDPGQRAGTLDGVDPRTRRPGSRAAGRHPAGSGRRRIR